MHQVLIFITGSPLSPGSATLSTSTVRAGGSLTVSGSGFAAGAAVSVYLGNQLLATYAANASGTVSGVVSIQAAAAPGTYAVQLIGAAPSSGTTRDDYRALIITR